MACTPSNLVFLILGCQLAHDGPDIFDTPVHIHERAAKLRMFLHHRPTQSL
jgi:hypothetical protein